MRITIFDKEELSAGWSAHPKHTKVKTDCGGISTIISPKYPPFTVLAQKQPREKRMAQ